MHTRGAEKRINNNNNNKKRAAEDEEPPRAPPAKKRAAEEEGTPLQPLPPPPPPPLQQPYYDESMRGVMIMNFVDEATEAAVRRELSVDASAPLEHDYVVKCQLTSDMWDGVKKLHLLVQDVSRRLAEEERVAFCSVEVRFYAWKLLDQHALVMHVRPFAAAASSPPPIDVQSAMYTIGKATKAAAIAAGVWDPRPTFGVFVSPLLRGKTSDDVACLVEHVGEVALMEFSPGSEASRDDIRWVRTSCDASQPPCIKKKRRFAINGSTGTEPSPETLASRFVLPLDVPGLAEAVAAESDEEEEEDEEDDEEEEEEEEQRRPRGGAGAGRGAGGGVVLEFVTGGDDDGGGGPSLSSRRPSSSRKEDLDRVMRHLADGAARDAVSRAFEECNKGGGLFGGGGCARKKQEWLDCVLRLPLGRFAGAECGEGEKSTQEVVRHMRDSMDAVVYGLDGAKDAVLEIAGKKLRSPVAPVRCLLLEGPPGCGKTTFATRAIGDALKRPVRVINLGGAKDSTTLVGHGYTYEGSRPGRIVEEVTASGVMDPVLVFDEVDKISESSSGQEIVNVLMRLVDPAQNFAFTDTYMPGIPLDMSRVFVVFLCNDVQLMNRILLDRVRVVTFPDMNRASKLRVLRDYIIPRALKDYGGALALTDPDASAEVIATRLVDEASCSSFSSSSVHETTSCPGGMRSLEKLVERLMMVANLRSLEHGAKSVSASDLERTLDAVREENRHNSVKGAIPMGLYT